MIKKLAVIRDNEEKSCPFGLPIPIACEKVGNSIFSMKPEENNHEQFVWTAEGKACPFLQKIMKNMVSCKFEEKSSQKDLVGSPIYEKMFSGSTPSGAYTFDHNWYTQTPLNSGPWYSMYSIESVASKNNKNDK